ncbi:MAG TPA: DUF4350 domain-containing protein [Candidatus Limnocylindria bacterium]|jgi:hypothetical protein|nr:DUF4350 domain-containing protein [Candidatus Limnocylindria bacterium]
MKSRTRFDPVYVIASVLSLLVLVAAGFVVGSAQSVRSGSVLDTNDGGASDLRRLVEGLAGRTVLVQGARFAPRESGATVLFILGVTELISEADVGALRVFLQDGRTIVVATDLGLAERSLLSAFGTGIRDRQQPGTYRLSSVVVAAAPARSIAIDQGASLSIVSRWSPIARSDGSVIGAMTREGRGTLIVVGSLAPFLNEFLGEGDNGRFALSLAASGFGPGRAVGFDEYHHGSHPSADLLAVLEGTWLGRSLLFVGLTVFAYLALSGRRLGPPLPADPRPPRSSLEYVRSFAGLVRRSHRDDIARGRLRRDLRTGLAAAYGIDTAAPFEQVLSAVEADRPERATEARAIDAALEGRLRDDELLRTVARIEHVLAKKETT